MYLNYKFLRTVMKLIKFAAVLLIFFTFNNLMSAATPPALPNPILIFIGAEYVTVGGRNVVRYKYDVFNKADYPNDMFAASPALPPCGTNNRSSRTWVDLFDQNGKRLNGFCAIGSPGNLTGIWFAVDADILPPSWIYIEMNDRQTNIKYKSNLAETVM